MSYQADIYQAVLNSAPIAAKIGEKFSWDIADPTETPPYIVAQTISNSDSGDMQGVRDTSFPLIQFACWSTSKAEAIEIMRIFESEFSGIEIPGESGTSLNFAGENSSYDPETRLFGEIRDFRASMNITTN